MFPAANISSIFRASLIHIFYSNGKNCLKRERPKIKEETENVPLISRDLELHTRIQTK